MGKLIYEGKETAITPNISLIEAGETVGVAFGCTQGSCGTCLVRIKKGLESLNALSEAEDFFGLNQDERLLCQMRLQQDDGEIELET